MNFILKKRFYQYQNMVPLNNLYAKYDNKQALQKLIVLLSN